MVNMPRGDAPLPAGPVGGSGGACEPGPALLRLLVVDDNRDNADCYTLLFRRSGLEVRTAYSGAEALAMAAEFRPQAMLLDIGMPDISGYEVARQIRNSDWGRASMLIAVSGWSQDTDKQQATAAGFDHHITKPIDFNKLRMLLAPQ